MCETASFSCVGVAWHGMPLKLYTQDTDLKEQREVHTLKYDTRTPKVHNSISKHSTRSIIQQKQNRTLNFSQHRQTSKTQLQPTSSMPLGFSAVTEHEK